ncbi:nucleoporin 62 like isoform X2 [Rhinichthys klamathensis goyatoka]|uniref:nucleoporin 62 like isoform X2 n=1 Tax=Rhinichthys klamathensis goyatoka TaxID=3034132 RepID=UPI0024B627A8|nr:nucleoporin 62 like isoform X2 [Rhinichthys klamathensis goyatoka]
MAFNFGQAGTGGFSFGPPKTTAAAPTGFGLQTSAPAGGGFSFGASQPQTQTFGQPQTQTLSQPQTQTFGQPQTQTQTFGQPQTQTFGQPQPQTQTFGQPQPQTQTFGQPQPQTQTFGQPQTQTFGQSQPQTQTFGQSQPQTQTFGQSQPQTQTFGNPPPQSQIAGLLAQPTQNNGGTQGGFSFGAQTQSSTSGGGFSFGASLPKLSTPAAAQPATTGMTLGASPAGTGFALGGLAPQTTAAQQPMGGFSFGTPKVQAASVAPTQPSPALSLGVQPTGLTLGAPTASIASTTAINFGIKTSATPAPTSSALTSQSMAAPISSLFANPIASTPATGFTLGASMASVAPVMTSASIAPTSLSLKPLGAAPAVTSAIASTGVSTGFSLGLKTIASTAPATTTSTAVLTTSTAPVMSYAQLEALINKWSSELEDQERHFLQQATQVNAWDRMLVENGEKITSLHKDMEKVKLDQRRLDQELDFILSQQKELEDLLSPLEESVKEQSGTIYMQNADEERERTYKLAENVDAQLKRMSQDLKEIIEHLNTSSGPGDTTDPLQQICKILNAHMDSLQWVEQNSVLLQRRVEEVSKVCENRSKEQEKSFRLNFQ